MSHPCSSSPPFHSPFLDRFSLYMCFFPHFALLSSDILNQGVIDNVLPSLSTSVNSLALVCFSHCLLLCVEQCRRPFCHPHSTPPLLPKCLHPDTLILVLEEMKSQNTSCNPQIRPAFFTQCLQVCKKASIFLPSFLRLYMQHKSEDCIISLFLFFLDSASAWEHEGVPWKRKSVHLLVIESVHENVDRNV